MIQTRDPKEIKASVLKTLQKLDPSKLKQVVASHNAKKNKGKKGQKMSKSLIQLGEKKTKINAVLGKKPTKLSKIKLHVAASAKPKKDKPVSLAQMSSTEQVDEDMQQKQDAKIKMFLEMQNGLKGLMHTQEQLHKLTKPNRDMRLS